MSKIEPISMPSMQAPVQVKKKHNLNLKPALAFCLAAQKADQYRETQNHEDAHTSDNISNIQTNLAHLSTELHKTDKVADFSKTKAFEEAFKYLEDRQYIARGQRVFKDREIQQLDSNILSAGSSLAARINAIGQNVYSRRLDQKQIVDMAQNSIQLEGTMERNSTDRSITR